MVFGTRVPKRQTTDATDQRLQNYIDNVGPGINRHPYATDESDLYDAELKRIADLNKKKADNRFL